MELDFSDRKPAVAERRGLARRRVFKGATGRFNHGYGAFECVVRNQSDSGARLSLGETTMVPPHFDLHICDETAPRAAHVRWRTMTAVGVVFD